MDDDGGMGIRNWAYFEAPMKNNLGLQLMSPVVDRDTKPLLSNAGFLHRDCGVPMPAVSMEFVRDRWINHRDINNNKVLHVLPSNPNYGVVSDDAPRAHTLQMLQPPEAPLEDDKVPLTDGSGDRKEAPLKKRSQSQGRHIKTPKPKKPKKVPSTPRGDTRKDGKTNTGLVINGIDLDLSGIPPPVCSCTGSPQQCYRWGVGGWQSACCTTSISMYPLPMSNKRRGARIAGRKMSLGAFKKVLEKLVGEGHNLSNPIDLKPYWAKHGTNKFVTIR